MRTTWLIGFLTISLALGACDGLERAAVTSPLVGARSIEERGTSEVVERLVTGRYTYVRLKSAPEGTWHVAMGAPQPERGDLVRWRGYGEIAPFHSDSLDRTFERLVFSSIDRAE